MKSETRSLEWFDSLIKRDFENGAVINEIRSVFKELATLRTQLKSVEAERDAHKEQREFIEKQNLELLAINKDALEKTVQLEADAAVMRGRLEVSSKCGKSALLRLNEAKNLLRDTVTQPGNISQVKIPPLWISRRDVFLNPNNKD